MIYNGDRFTFTYDCKIDGKQHEFKNEHLLVVIYNALRKNDYILKEIEISEPTTNLVISISSNEMKKLKPGKHILEIKFIQDNEPLTTLHEELMIVESWWKNV